MRVALLSHQWPGARIGGIGAYVRQCAAMLALAGHEAHVFTLTANAKNTPQGVILHEDPDLAERVAGGDLPPALAAAVNSGGEGFTDWPSPGC